MERTSKVLLLNPEEAILYEAVQSAIIELCKGRTFYDGYFDKPLKDLSRQDKAIKILSDALRKGGYC